LGILLFIAAVIGIIYLAVLTNERIRDQFTVNILETVQENRFPVVYNLANRLEFAERLIYWVSAFLVFSRYPFLGVGLGNTGFFFRETVPAFSSHLPEINFILSPNTLTFANPKSLWLRLLAETGLLGFMAFLVWLMLLGLSAFKLQRREGLRAAIGVAGGMALLVQIFEGLSLDTFALPQLWVMLGLLTAAYSFDSRNPEQDA
jgi:O-antigen ligase